MRGGAGRGAWRRIRRSEWKCVPRKRKKILDVHVNEGRHKGGGGNDDDTWTVQKDAEKYGILAGVEKKTEKELMNERSEWLTVNMERFTGARGISCESMYLRETRNQQRIIGMMFIKKEEGSPVKELFT